MRVLLALPDRDLLTGLTKLMTRDGHEVTGAVDGVKALEYAAAPFDVAVADCRLPRLPLFRVVDALRDKGVPVVLLWDQPITPAVLTGDLPAASYLPYPFRPSELMERIDAVIGTSSVPPFSVGEILVEPSRFLVNGKVSVTREEIALLQSLAGTVKAPADAGLFAASLNEKFRRLGLSRRFRWQPGTGYGMVECE